MDKVYQLHPQRETGCDLQTQGWMHGKEPWDVKIVPHLNRDIFSITKGMKEGSEMNGRWKEGGLIIELFKTTRASMKFDRMILSGSSWLMGVKFQRVMDHAHVQKLQFSFYLDLLSPEIYNSVGSFIVFPIDCLFTCIFHSL